jgi:hypothetical protein
MQCYVDGCVALSWAGKRKSWSLDSVESLGGYEGRRDCEKRAPLYKTIGTETPRENFYRERAFVPPS